MYCKAHIGLKNMNRMLHQANRRGDIMLNNMKRQAHYQADIGGRHALSRIYQMPLIYLPRPPKPFKPVSLPKTIKYPMRKF